MKIDFSQSFTTPPINLLALLASPELMHARAQAIQAKVPHAATNSARFSFTQNSTPQGKIASTHFDLTLSVQELPEQVRSFLAKGLHLRIDTYFTPPAPKYPLSSPSAHALSDLDSARINFNIICHNAPVQISAQAVLKNLVKNSADTLHQFASTPLSVKSAYPDPFSQPCPAETNSYPTSQMRTPDSTAELSTQTKLNYQIEVNVNIPFLGKIIESKLKSFFQVILQHDGALIAQICRDNSPHSN